MCVSLGYLSFPDFSLQPCDYQEHLLIKQSLGNGRWQRRELGSLFHHCQVVLAGLVEGFAATKRWPGGAAVQ